MKIRIYSLEFITLFVIHAIRGVFSQRTAAMGWTKTYINAVPSINLTLAPQFNYYAPLSIVYNALTGMLMTGNGINGGQVTEFPSFPTTGLQSGEFLLSNSNVRYLSEKNDSFGVFGISFNSNNNSVAYAGVGVNPFEATASTACGVLVFNPQSGQNLQYFSLSSMRNPVTAGECFIGYVTYDAVTGYLYASDFLGYQMLRITTSPATGFLQSASILSRNMSALCGGYPDQCATGSYNGPQQMVIYVDAAAIRWLLIGVSPNLLIKMDATSGAWSSVMPGMNSPLVPLGSVDGMILTPQQNAYDCVLYIASKQPGTTGQVYAVTSKDMWVTFDLSCVYGSSCPVGYTSSGVAIVNSDLAIICNHPWVSYSAMVTILPDVVMDPISFIFESIVSDNMVPQAFDYFPQRNQLIVGSMENGALTAWPYYGSIVNNADTSVNYTNDYLETIIASGSDFIYGSYGIRMHVENDCMAFVCMGGFPANPSAVVNTGLYYVNVCTRNVSSYVSLPAIESGFSTANDVVVVGNVAYVTDWFGSQLWSVDFVDGVLSNPQTLLNSSSCAQNDPSFCLYLPDGIVAITNTSVPYLVIGLLQVGMAKYVPSTKQFLKVGDPMGLLGQMDGMVLSNNGQVVYGARNGMEFTNYQSVMAVVSCDDWQNATVVYNFQLSWMDQSATVPRLITNADGSQDLVALMNDNFGSGPYSFTRIQDVNAKVAGSNYANICPDSLATDSNINSGGGGSSCQAEETTIIALSVILGACGVVGAIALFLLTRKLQPPEGSKSHPVKLQMNPMLASTGPPEIS